MKRIITLLTFVLLTMSLVAQQRMHFLGQPLGCSLATFKQRMASKGYKYKGEEETNIHCFSGVFGGDDVTVGVCVTPKSKTVYMVMVNYNNFRSNSSKSTLDFKKNSLIQSFIKKYGNYTGEDDIFTYWLFDYGRISLGLDYNERYPIMLFYIDELGEKKYDTEIESDY